MIADLRGVIAVSVIHGLLLLLILLAIPGIASIGAPTMVAAPVAAPLPPRDPEVVRALPDPSVLRSASEYTSWGGRLYASPPGVVQIEKDLERDLMGVINAKRVTPLTPLEPEEGFQRAARMHAIDQALRGFDSDLDPELRNTTDRVAVLHRRYVGLPAGFGLSHGHGTSGLPSAAELARDLLAQPNAEEALVSPEKSVANALYGLGIASRLVGEQRVYRVSLIVGPRGAMLAAPLPLTARVGDIPNLAFDTAASGGVAPQTYELWEPEKGTTAFSGGSTTAPQPFTTPGVYRFKMNAPPRPAPAKGKDAAPPSWWRGPEVTVK
ncbi:MAG: hypothetical protein H7840_16360 [Alphaproteobacteria bacterium]